MDVYAGVAASLAERKKGGQLTEFLKNIRGTIEDDEWDQVMCTVFLCAAFSSAYSYRVSISEIIIYSCSRLYCSWEDLLEV